MTDALAKSDIANEQNYKKMFESKDQDLFSLADDTASFISAYDTYINVKIGKSDLVFNAGRKYLCKQSQTNLTEFAIDDVKYITIKGNKKCFAFPGFIYDGVKYRIDGLFYKTMYRYITIGDNDLSMLHTDLIKLANIIDDKVNNLPEIDFCKDAKVVIDNHIIKITDGMNTITTYCELDENINIDDKNNYIKSKTIIGKFCGEPHVFLKIGKRTYKIVEIKKYQAAEYLYKSGYFG